jgi:hypothetical protein
VVGDGLPVRWCLRRYVAPGRGRQEVAGAHCCP